MKQETNVLTPFPFTDLSTVKRRPAVIISKIEESKDDVVAFISSKITSSLSESDYLLDSSHKDFANTGLHKSSVFKMDKLVTVIKKILLLIFLLPVILCAQSNYSKYVPDVDSFMNAQVTVKKFNGNILIAQDGNVIYKKSFGYSNYDTKKLLDENSVFDIASVSKQFTAMGILLLIEKGKLKFTDTLRRFFPELPYPNITIRNLLIHTSGLPNYIFAMIEKWDHSKIAFNDDLIRFLAEEKLPLNFQPGERFEYSNAAYSLMASIIEKVSGQSFSVYMQENIFKPLGMNSSLILNTRRTNNILPDDYALGYVYSDSLQKYILPDSTKEYEFVRFLDGITGDGIVNTTTSDLLKWDRAMKNNTLLSETMQSEMVSHQSLYDTTRQIYYGYGVLLDSGSMGKRIFHGGAWPGYSTVLMRYVKDDITIIILSNNQTYATSIAFTLGNILLGGMYELPYKHTETMIDNSINKFTGKYLFPNKYVLILIAKDGKLYQQIETGDIEFKSESELKFFSGDGADIQIEFGLDENGNVSKAYIIDTGLKAEIRKL